MQENSETSVSIGPTFATNSNPRCSQINPTITGGSFSVPNSGVGMNPSLITRALGKSFGTKLLSSWSNTGLIRDDPYWTSRKNSSELIELSSINKVSLV